MTLYVFGAGHTVTVKGFRAKTVRRRMVDMGILPGTLIENVMPSAVG